MKKILHIITTINRGGAENHLYTLIKGQVALGYEVGVAFLKGDGYWISKYETLGVSVYRLGMLFYGDVFSFIRLLLIVKKYAPELIHCHMPPSEVYGFLIRFLLGRKIKLIISKHNVSNFYDGPFSTVIGSKIGRSADHIIAISNAVKNHVNKYSIDQEKVSVIYYGLDRTEIEGNAFVKKPENSSGLTFGTACRLVPQKALPVMLNAFSMYCRKFNSSDKLVIVGSGILEKQLKKLADQLDINDKVIWMGQSENVVDIMKSFDVFLLTSDFEGFGLVLIEAMSVGLPIIATKVSSIPEIVINGTTGILIPPQDPTAVCDAMVQLQNKPLRYQFGNAGRERALTYFNSDMMVKLTGVVYKKFLS